MATLYQNLQYVWQPAIDHMQLSSQSIYLKHKLLLLPLIIVHRNVKFSQLLKACFTQYLPKFKSRITVNIFKENMHTSYFIYLYTRN